VKRRQVVYTADAADDLETIYDTIAEAHSPAAAAGYEQRIRVFCDSLAYGAERGSVRENTRPGLRVIGFERRVSVAFVVEGDRVVILRLFYGGRDWGEDLR
jgi:toxin ParE1/3/4